MSNFKQNPNFPQIGSMMQKKENDKQGRAAYYIKISDDVKVTVNGKEVKFLNIQRPTDKYDYKVENGKMTGEEYDEAVARFQEGGDLSYIKFEITADLRPPKK